MNLFGKVKHWIHNDGGESTGISLSTINELFFGAGNAKLGPDMSEITYFTCLKTLAEALGVSPSALDIPRIKSREALNQLLLALEDEYGLTVTIMENNERSICNGK